MAEDPAAAGGGGLWGALRRRLRAGGGGGGAGGGRGRPLELGSFVRCTVMETEAIDLHTHLFPPSHGDLMHWGIDALLTYHYLVAEFFMTAEGVSPDEFYALPQSEQADRVWRALFVERCPLSEACRGVLTTLRLLGLEEAVAARDLKAVRAWYRARGQGRRRPRRPRAESGGEEGEEEEEEEGEGQAAADAFAEGVFRAARVRYCVMTNVPFDPAEAAHWRPRARARSGRFRSALRVDPLLAGDWAAVARALGAQGLPGTAEGARRYLLGWADTMKPEYLMASTPHNFFLSDQTEEKSNPPENPDLLEEVLIPVAIQLNLPIALKLGARRGLNPALGAAGDGLAPPGEGVAALAALCRRHPQVKFLATFLARGAQHEACVLANKFPNLHLYGCWWYCNNPSVIDEITRLRLELLGAGGWTAQHSDARVLDQLLYKWDHSRKVIGNVLAEYYTALEKTGWRVTRGEVRRAVARLLGGDYERFLQKDLRPLLRPGGGGGETRNYDDGNKQLEGVVGIGGSLLEENDSETASITSKPNKKRLKKGSTSFK